MDKETRSLLIPTSVGMVPPSEIFPNPHNPRLFFPEETLKILKDSIARVGILVPLTVYRSKADGKFHLLDGERRWRCAVDLHLSAVPVNIVPEPTTLQNIVTMFNIHALREPWELMPTALKLEVLIRTIKQETGKKRIGVKFLSEITGLSPAILRRCQILLSLPKQYQDLILARDEQRLKTDFFIELLPAINKIEKTFPKIAADHPRNDILDRFITKYRDRVITDVVDFRKIPSFINSVKKGVPKDLVEHSIRRMIEEPKAPIEDLYPPSAQVILKLNELNKLAENIITQIRQFKTKDPLEFQSFTEILHRLVREINKEITRRQKE